MGGGTSSKFSKDHVLHFTKPDENRLYLFDTLTERFYNFPCFWKGKPFFFAKLSSIMIPQHSKLFILGGLGYNNIENFKYLHKKGSNATLSQEENISLDINEISDEELSQIEADDSHTISFYAKLNTGRDDLLPSSLVGYFDIHKTRVGKLTFNADKHEQFDYTVNNSIIVYANEWIYVFGGIIDGKTSGKSKKMHVEKGVWIDITSIEPLLVTNQAGAIAIKDIVYVFNSKEEIQKIHKYSIGFDVWEQFEFKTPGFLIPPTSRPSLFQVDKNFLLYLNGKDENGVNHLNYFVYSLENDMFVQERSDRKLLGCLEDHQGNKNYVQSKKLYTYLNDSCVKVFFKETWFWETIDVYFIKIRKQKGSIINLNLIGCFKRK